MRIKQLLESASVGGMSTGSVATAPSKAGKMQRRQGNLLAAEGNHPKTWHDVDKKLGKATDKMSQAEKVKKGLAHPDTLKKQGVAEGVAETVPMEDAVKVLKHYGAEHFKTTSNELHFYKNGKGFSVDLIFNDDATRSVNLSQLNSITRSLKGQGIAEGELDEACWKDYKQIGMKKKGGKQVPNCVPKESVEEGDLNELNYDTLRSYSDKADDQIVRKHRVLGPQIKAGDAKAANKTSATIQKRMSGIDKAAKRMNKDESVEENKKGVRAVKHTVKPRNFVAKNAVQSGAGAHKDKKKAQKQGDTKHKGKELAYESKLWAALDRRIGN